MLTDQEKLDFINQVKGKKLTWTRWIRGDYFIPNGSYDKQVTMFYGADQDGDYTSFLIGEGFQDYHGHCWKLYDSEEETKDEFKVGDKVKFIIDDPLQFKAIIGTVINVLGGGWYEVSDDSSTSLRTLRVMGADLMHHYSDDDLKALEDKKETKCKHDQGFVNCGFTSITIVCKKCGKLKEEIDKESRDNGWQHFSYGVDV